MLVLLDMSKFHTHIKPSKHLAEVKLETVHRQFPLWGWETQGCDHYCVFTLCKCLQFLYRARFFSVPSSDMYEDILTFLLFGSYKPVVHSSLAESRDVRDSKQSATRISRGWNTVCHKNRCNSMELSPS
jgi:hypothetical protein